MPNTNFLNTNKQTADGPDRKPSHWPQHLRYLTSCTYHHSVSSAVKQHVQLGTRATPNSKFPKVCIRQITDPTHPANGQFGLFAGQRIYPRTRILYYIGARKKLQLVDVWSYSISELPGEIHCEDREDSNYDLSLCRLPDGTSVGIDATSMGNEARFVNDFRGIAKKPNAIFVDERTSSGELAMSIWSSGEQIQKGEEILVSYGKSWWKSRAEEQG